jgi:hypothetical protein
MKSIERTEESSKVGEKQKRRKNHEERDSRSWIGHSGSSLRKALDSRTGNRGIARSEVSAFSHME